MNFLASLQERIFTFRGVPIGVLVFHENTGLTDHEKERATRLASLGYIALACDMFGERATAPATDAERRAAFEEFRAQKLLPRVLAGLTALSAQPQVDTQRMAAIGFCLGEWPRWNWRASALI